MCIYSYIHILEKLKKRYITTKDNTTETGKTKSKGPQLSQWTTFGNHIYRRKGEVAAVEFVNEEYGIRKLIVDDNGYILNYPGSFDKISCFAAYVQANAVPMF